MMNFALNTGNCVLKTRNVVLKMMKFAAPSIRDVSLGGGGMLQVKNGSTTGCLVLLEGTDNVVHEPEPAACAAHGRAAQWTEVPVAAHTSAAAVQLQNNQNKSACLIYGNGTPTDFGSRSVSAVSFVHK